MTRMLSLIAGLLALSLTLTGCTKTNSTTQSNANRSYGTAQVRGSDTGNTQEMGMSSEHMEKSMQQCQTLMKNHLGNADTQYDLRFIDMMIPHHQGAITMAKDALQKAQHPEIKKMAQNIINSQQQEIKQLQAWRQSWYGSQPAATNP